jgi:L-ascorbate metabolism protein UlaG (beta-lactamase superfamily)
VTASVTFRWLGVAGFELRIADEVLAVDPFFTRPTARQLLLGSALPDVSLSHTYLPSCDHVFVTHTHYDHVMDVPSIAQRTGATAYVPPDGRPLLEAHGVSAERSVVVRPGDEIELRQFSVAVLAGKHIHVPGLVSRFLSRRLAPAPRTWDYTPDIYLSYLFQIGTIRVLRGRPVDGSGRPADVFLVGPEGSEDEFGRLLGRTGRPIVIPVHWDDFLRPVSMPVRPRLGLQRRSGRLLRRVDLAQLSRIIRRVAPQARFIVPELLRPYDLNALVKERHLATELVE